MPYRWNSFSIGFPSFEVFGEGDKGEGPNSSPPPSFSAPFRRTLFSPAAMQSTSKAEAERLLGIAEKLLQGKDLNGCRDFALLAQETEPLLDGSDQILAVVDVLIAADKRINKHPDWYGILQLENRRNDDELIKRQYRRLALLLHPDKNKFPFADAAFKLVADAWALLSDPSRKSAYDNELFAFSKVDLVSTRKQGEKENQNQNQNQNHPIQREKIPVRRNPADVGPTANQAGATASSNQTGSNIWTACPYCYNLYEYPKMYEGCCLRCAGCKRAFQAVVIPPSSLPPSIPGKEAYYCCWGYFPMGFAMSNSETAKTLTIPNWMPPMFPTNAKAWPSADSLPNGSSVPLAEPGEAFVAPLPRAPAPAPAPVPTPAPAPVPVSTPVPVPVPVPVQVQVQSPQPTLQKKPTPPTAGATVPRKRGRPRKNPLP
ncbi:hypothetical protein L1887_23884 [Cichorium endivia]|nr:hypothetical protein L1887_23884 [Cichorium endivia]